MKFSVLTLFPELVNNYVDTSILGRARERELFELETIDIRDYAINDYGQVDDSLYGGGRGMLLMCEPIYQAWSQANKDSNNAKTLVMDASGKSFTQEMATELSSEEHIIILCGHYEGIDARVLDEIAAEKVSVGDYVLTGGELSACLVIDAVTRLLPGVLPSAAAWKNESFASGLLSERQYTRPESWHNHNVPAVLLSGHDAKIKRHRLNDRLWQTIIQRPDLLENLDLSYEQYYDFLLWLDENKDNNAKQNK